MKRVLLPLLLLALPASTAALAAAADEAQNPLESFLEEARTSYVLEAREKEIVNRHDNGAFLFENEYRYEMTKTRNVSLEKAAFGETSAASHVVRDEQGRPAQEYLSYDNKVSTYALSNTSYDIDYGNPFVYVAPSDFEEIAEGVYKLDDLKAYEFAYRLLRLDYPLKDVLFNFEDGTFKNITISTPAFEGVTQDQYTYEYMLIDYSYETEVRLSELGTAVVEGVKTAESRDPEHEEALRAALTSLPDSFTVVISEHDRDYEANHEYDAYMYYDGEAIFHQLTLGSLTSGLYYCEEDERPDGKLYLQDYDADAGKWVHYDAISSRSYNADPKTYDDLLPRFKDVAPELFTYDAENDIYVCDNLDALGFMGNPLSPGTRHITYFTEGQTDKATIKLKSDGRIDTVTVGYSYEDSQGYQLSRDIDYRYINLGTTTMPDGFTGR